MRSRVEIRAARSPSSRLIATWAVSFKTDGSDGWLILTLDDSDSTSITDRIGYMDLKRVTAGEPVSMLDEPLQVEFRKVVTA
jgi:hypothetical protein